MVHKTLSSFALSCLFWFSACLALAVLTTWEALKIMSASLGFSTFRSVASCG